jgi:NTE family protein
VNKVACQVSNDAATFRNDTSEQILNGTGTSYSAEQAHDDVTEQAHNDVAEQAANETRNNKTRPKVGVVLSGGGAKGIAHIGILSKIEELGIPVDYIVGTSIGSIVGGLYAYGYTAAQLDTIFRTADWNEVLSDKQDRSYTNLIEKQTDDNYMFTLPFGKKIKSIVPVSFIRGQHIGTLFYLLTADAYKYKSFDDFHIPFRCVATEMTTGKEYVFSNGNLAQAMRSSMAVPGVFNPVIYNDTLLMVDGGIVNNFPVDVVKEMGADIVIGINVGFDYGREAESYNLANIIEATVFIASREKTERHKKMCDLLIEPNTNKFGSTSFNNVDLLLEVGYKTANDVEPELKKIAAIFAEHKAEDNSRVHRKVSSNDKEAKVFVSHIEFKGLNKYTTSFANHALQIKENAYNSLWEISEGIERLYGTLVFSEVSYDFFIDPEDYEKTIVNVSVRENPNNAVKIGFRYDSERDVVFLAGIVLRNLGLKNSRILIDAEICGQSNISAEYLFMPDYVGRKKRDGYSLWKPSLGLRYQYAGLNSELYHDNQRIQFKLQRHSIRLRASSNWRNSILGLGVHLDYTRTLNHETRDSNYRDKWYTYPCLSFEHNSYNKRFYPTKGWKMNANIKYINSINKNENILAGEFLTAFAHGEGVFSFLKNYLSMYWGFTVATVFFQDKDYIPLAYRFYQGGQSPLSGWDMMSTFPGLPLTSDDGKFLWNFTLGLQGKIIKNLYVSLRGGIGESENSFGDMFLARNLVYGGNIGVSYNTPIGPVGISFQSSNRRDFGVFINVFYWY